MFYIVGLKKNSGKTTVLNRLLETGAEGGFGVLSVGIDGEDRDLIEDTPKPAVLLPEGTLFMTTDRMLAASDIGAAVLRFLDINTPLGELLIARVWRAGSAVIVGPSNNRQVRDSARLMQQMGARFVFVDGAFDRRTQLFGPEMPEVRCFFCAAPKPLWDEHRFVAETKHSLDLLSLPYIQLPANVMQLQSGAELVLLDDSFRVVKAMDVSEVDSSDGELASASYVLVSNALTRPVADAILKLGVGKAIVRSGVHVFLDYKSFGRFAKRVELYQLSRIRVVAMFVRSTRERAWALDPKLTLSLLRKQIPQIPIFDLFLEGGIQDG